MIYTIYDLDTRDLLKQPNLVFITPTKKTMRFYYIYKQHSIQKKNTQNQKEKTGKES